MTVTDTPSTNKQFLNLSIDELQGLTKNLVELQIVHKEIKSNSTLAFRHDLGSILDQPLTPNSAAPSGISSGPAIHSDYPPSDDTEITDHFVTDNIDLASVYSGFANDRLTPQPPAQKQAKNRGPANNDRVDHRSKTPAVEARIPAGSHVPWQLAPEVINPLMTLDSEVGSQAQAPSTRAQSPIQLEDPPVAPSAESPVVSALWRALQRSFADWTAAKQASDILGGDIALAIAQSTRKALERKMSQSEVDCLSLVRVSWEGTAWNPFHYRVGSFMKSPHLPHQHQPHLVPPRKCLFSTLDVEAAADMGLGLLQGAQIASAMVNKVPQVKENLSRKS
ncbi:hypothetical protein CROQUDRAFT_91448 [Cronartium quercuum f. sp. fusiforme G11]|uniref:Uncharacterized protein n=1 Tax=Cronartium quercuum f. sp. fusiforme G11 TaxID=708437 RepID=A0A9P6NI30_9BASI|nr:hypothetical protein CROQUDRAFT_91448 [Cronartium quercuum f. sp. fusiforme G11]